MGAFAALTVIVLLLLIVMQRRAGGVLAVFVVFGVIWGVIAIVGAICAAF